MGGNVLKKLILLIAAIAIGLSLGGYFA